MVADFVGAPIIGLTGSFGSGCSTIAAVLKDRFGFGVVRVSDFIRAEAQKAGVSEPTREELQNIGDEARKARPAAWAEQALQTILKIAANGKVRGWVIDGLRNLEEVNYLRHQPRFVLIAADCQPASKRFNRISVQLSAAGKGYPGGWQQFQKDDERDRDDDKPHGQQVVRCVDDADILITNDADIPDTQKLHQELEERLDRYVALIEGKVREPTPAERMMNAAYVLAEGSTCMRRQVGAVIVEETGGPRGGELRIVSASYNENPPPLRACRIEFAKVAKAFQGCYRDQRRFDDVRKVIPFIAQGQCPKCKQPLAGIEQNPSLHCPHCNKNLYKEFFAGRGNEHCTALHAEERAILHARTNLAGCTLYCTTFPCFLCSKKLLEVRIRRLVYVDPYPNPDASLSLELFERQGISVERFDGVKGKAFHTLFRNWEKPSPEVA
jgi:deoxycytidylate deaminase